jgi:hypothetical protein
MTNFEAYRGCLQLLVGDPFEIGLTDEDENRALVSML